MLHVLGDFTHCFMHDLCMARLHVVLGWVRLTINIVARGDAGLGSEGRGSRNAAAGARGTWAARGAGTWRLWDVGAWSVGARGLRLARLMGCIKISFRKKGACVLPLDPLASR